MKQGILIAGTLILLAGILHLFLNNAQRDILSLKAEQGELNLENSPESDLIALEGEWEFYWREWVSPTGEQQSVPLYTDIPQSWHQIQREGDTLPVYGYGTYRLRIAGLKPGEIYGLYQPEMLTNYRLIIDGREVLSDGVPGINREESIPSYKPQITAFSSDDGYSEILLQTSNFHYRKSGVWRPLYLGSLEEIHQYRQNRVIIEALLIGSLLIIGLYHIGIYLFRNQELSALYFGLFSLLSVIRVSTTGEHLFTGWFPFISWDLARRLEFALPVFGAWLFLKFSNALFPKDKIKKLTDYYSIQTAIISLPSLLLPVYLSNNLVDIMLSHMMIGILVSSLTVIRATSRRRSGSPYVAIGSLILIYSAINDILYSKGIFGSLYLVPTGFFIFLFFQTIMLSRKFTNSFNEVESLSIRLSDFNKALRRFVPFEFLDILNKKSIIDVTLGDQVQKNMTILFADIRRFTEISEKMTPQENFNFLNSYLKRIGPIIRRHQGFIDKYIGDAVMALFPNSPEKALKAAIEMQMEVRKYNIHRANSGYPPVAIGIGVHIGDSILGTIGEQNRLETTVIADAVNVTSRLENFTKEVGASLIISGQFKEMLPNPHDFNFRSIGTIHLRGRQEPLELFEVLDGYDEEEFNIIMKINTPFEKALTAYNGSDYNEALKEFHKIHQKHPQDGPTLYYIARCQTIINNQQGLEYLEEL